MCVQTLKDKEVKQLPIQISIMKNILRFLQLLCENHNRDLQVSQPWQSASTVHHLPSALSTSVQTGTVARHQQFFSHAPPLAFFVLIQICPQSLPVQ